MGLAILQEMEANLSGHRASHQRLPIRECRFALSSDSHGSYIRCVDAMGEVTTPASSPTDSSELIAITSEYNQAVNLCNQSLGWSSEVSEVRTALYSSLVTRLVECRLLVLDEDKNFEVVRMAAGRAQLKLDISEVQSSVPTKSASSIVEVTARLTCVNEDDTSLEFQCLSSTLALCNSTLYTLNTPLVHAMPLQQFEVIVPISDLPRVLSLMLSYVPSIDIQSLYWSIRRDKSIEPLEPSLLIEDVTSDLAVVAKILSRAPSKVATDRNAAQERYGWRVAASIDDRTITLVQEQPDAIVQCTNSFLRLSQKLARKAKLKCTVHAEDNRIILPVDLALRMFGDDLDQVLNEFRLFNVEKLDSFKITSKVPQLRVTFDGKQDFFDSSDIPVSAEVLLGEDKLPIEELLRAYNPVGYIEVKGGRKILVPPRFVRALRLLFEKRESGKTIARTKTKPRSQATNNYSINRFDLPILDSVLDAELQPEAVVAWAANQRQFLSKLGALPATPPISAAKDQRQIQATLREYQQYGISWLEHLQSYGMGGILADDMGLGKTIQTIAVLSKIHGCSDTIKTSNARKRETTASRPKKERSRVSIVIAPRSLLFNWQSEIERFAPWLTSYCYHGPDRRLDEALLSDVLITTYATLRNDIEKLAEVNFIYVVLDEAQAVKNVFAQTSQAVSQLKAKHRLALSGTPIENSIVEVFALFSFLNPGMFRSLRQFEKQYIQPIQRDHSREVAELLRRKIAPYILRRMKTEVLNELPDKMEQTITVELESDHASVYKESAKYFSEMVRKRIDEDGVRGSQMHIFQALMQLRQIASTPSSRVDGNVKSSKLPLLIEMLQEAAGGGHKALVFAHFLSSIEEIAGELESEGIGYQTLTGSTGDREAVVRRFTEDPRCAVLVMTLKTGGVGLNLVAADTVFIYEPWWNSAAEQQAIDRCYRIGQKKSVSAYRLVAKGTIEEKMNILQSMKKDLFDQLILTDGTIPKCLSAEDIEFLLSL